MEQTLSYRNVRYVVSHEQDSRRDWVIYPDDGPSGGADRGIALADGARGSFKSAVMAARQAIDHWVETCRVSAL